MSNSSLLPVEKTWQTKFRFFSGHIIKSDLVLRKDDKFANNWHNRWLILSGKELISLPCHDKYKSVLERRIKQNAYKAMEIIEPREIERLSILQFKVVPDTALFGTDKWRILINEIFFSFPTESLRNDWIKAIDNQTHLLKFYYVPVLQMVEF